MGDVDIGAKVQRCKCGVETVYLNMHNSNKLKEAIKEKKIVNVHSNSFCLFSLHILHIGPYSVLYNLLCGCKGQGQYFISKKTEVFSVIPT